MKSWGWAILALAFCAVQYKLWLGQGGLVEQAELRGQVSVQREQIAALEAENERLRAEVAALNTPEGLEEEARERLGLVRPNERLIRVLPE